MQINFCDTSKNSFSRAIGGIFLSLAKTQICYHIANQFVRNFSLFFATVPILVTLSNTLLTLHFKYQLKSKIKTTFISITIYGLTPEFIPLQIEDMSNITYIKTSLKVSFASYHI